jgi:hypothetical protein
MLLELYIPGRYMQLPVGDYRLVMLPLCKFIEIEISYEDGTMMGETVAILLSVIMEIELFITSGLRPPYIGTPTSCMVHLNEEPRSHFVVQPS